MNQAQGCFSLNRIPDSRRRLICFRRAGLARAAREDHPVLNAPSLAEHSGQPGAPLRAGLVWQLIRQIILVQVGLAAGCPAARIITDQVNPQIAPAIHPAQHIPPGRSDPQPQPEQLPPQPRPDQHRHGLIKMGMIVSAHAHYYPPPAKGADGFSSGAGGDWGLAGRREG